MTFDTSDLEKAERAIARATNRRQARRILDARDDAALVAHDSGRTIYVTISDAGLYTVCYGTGGGLYDARTCRIGWIDSLNRRADTIDVDHDPTPSAVTYPAPNRGDQQ